MSYKIKSSIKTCFHVFSIAKLLGYCLITSGRTLFCLFILIIPVIAVHAEVAQPELAGHVTLVIGQALAINKDHQQRELKRDDDIYSGETIETSMGGHVHLHFVDDGMMSLRPNSRLIIEVYHYDKQQASNSAIRFTLQSGVIRSISGKATEADHQRFRLNTPITAIGVLGTDFIVRAEPEKLWAGVYSGAIAIAPLSNHCLANSLGTCAGATQLTESMGGVMLEFNHGKVHEKLLPIDPAILSKSKPINVEGSENATTTTASFSTPTSNSTSTSATVGRITPIDIVVVDALAHKDDFKPLTLVQSPLEKPAVVQASSLVWERWFWAAQSPGDTITKPMGSVAAANFTGAGNSYAGLYTTAPLTNIQSQTGVYSFSLTQGHVYFAGNGQSDLPTIGNPGLAQLSAASLQVDFGSKTFNTQLAMNYQSISASLNLSGAIQNSGYFGLQNASGNSTVSGSISANGANAGMAFVQQNSVGTFTGLTDWVKK